MKHEPINSGRVLGYRAFQVLNLIKAEVDKVGYLPSCDAICKELRIGSKGEVSRILSGLERRGHIFRLGPKYGRKIIFVRNTLTSSGHSPW